VENGETLVRHHSAYLLKHQGNGFPIRRQSGYSSNTKGQPSGQVEKKEKGKLEGLLVGQNMAAKKKKGNLRGS